MAETPVQNAGKVLTELESKTLLKQSGIPVVDARLARTAKEAVALSKEIGFPVVLKIISPDVVHKSDAGGVKLGLENATQVRKAYSEIMSSVRHTYPDAHIDGVSVQPMAPPGVEVIVGVSRDPQFGPVIMFGLGGVLVEVLKDVSFRVVPVSKSDASEMIRAIKGYPLLTGYRGAPPASTGALEDLIVKVSQFVESQPAVSELDLNPVFAYSDRVVAVDARIVMDA
jgi:acetyl-CoA synthetase (ADP-forming)